MRRRLLRSALALATLFGASPALAAGWDTPILYSAEHMGMGGAAIGYVDDPSAIFHNPAGIVRTEGLTLMANVTLILGSITSSPSASQNSIDSEPIRAVAPLIAATYKVNDWFAAGIAFYPVASAGAVYKYKNASDKEVENSTDVVFLEISPSVAFALPGNVTLGAGYRISSVSLTRYDVPELTPLDFTLAGWNFAGLRLGAQWQPIHELEFGVVYRHKTETHLEDPSAIVVTATPNRKASGDLVLPSKLGFGTRVKLSPLSIVLDVEYTLQSQNQELVIDTDPALVGLKVNSVFRWKDTVTLRTGLEYGIDDTYFIRGGFIYDTQATQKKWPSAFGTPPGPTMTGTLGFGFKPDAPWDLNFAMAYRTGSATVTTADIEAGATEYTCVACSKAGDYSLSMLGAYLDFTYSFH